MLTLRADTVHVWYLDASALVKLVVDEGDHVAVREFYGNHPNCHATLPCLMEALGAIKAKWTHKHITHTQYMRATSNLVIDVWGRRLRADNVYLFSLDGFVAVQALAKKHQLDLSDALQLETLINGTFKHLADDARPILITADRKLGEAAEREGIRVWHCITDPAPMEV